VRNGLETGLKPGVIPQGCYSRVFLSFPGLYLPCAEGLPGPGLTPGLRRVLHFILRFYTRKRASFSPVLIRNVGPEPGWEPLCASSLSSGVYFPTCRCWSGMSRMWRMLRRGVSHRGFTEGFSSRYPIFHTLSLGRRSNSAHGSITTVTLLRTLRRRSLPFGH